MNFLLSKDRQYLDSREVVFEEVIDGSQKGILFPQFRLPFSKYDVNQADILILLPQGYPDAPPDMFFLQPWVRLVQSNRYPRAADQPFMFSG